MIELRPRAGVRLRRPATVSILVASGYPREVVPQVVNADLASAQSKLEAKHLRLPGRLPADAERDRVNQVVGQIPAAGAVVYRGSRIRVTVARTYRWVNLFRWSGTDHFQSDPFTVPARWRIRYRLAGAASLPAIAQLFWLPERRAVCRRRDSSRATPAPTATSCRTAPAPIGWPCSHSQGRAGRSRWTRSSNCACGWRESASQCAGSGGVAARRVDAGDRSFVPTIGARKPVFPARSVGRVLRDAELR